MSSEIAEYVRFIHGEYEAGRLWVCKNPPSLGQFLAERQPDATPSDSGQGDAWRKS